MEQCCRRLHVNGNTSVWGQTGLVFNDKNGSLPGGQLHSSNVISSHLSYLISMVLIKLDQHDPRRPASLQGDIYVYVRGWFVWLGAAAVFCWPCLYARIHRCVYMTER